MTSLPGLDSLIGFTLTEQTGDRVVGTFTVTEALHQPYGIVHGGVYCSVIETAASVAGATWLGDRGHVVGSNNNTNFLRAVSSGTMTVTATPIHRGRTQQLWQVDIVDDHERLVATGQVRLANIQG